MYGKLPLTFKPLMHISNRCRRDHSKCTPGTNTRKEMLTDVGCRSMEAWCEDADAVDAEIVAF